MASVERTPLADSPWFWVLLFAGMALAALLAIGPKYGGRQARLERQYQARERILADRHGNNRQPLEETKNEGERRRLSSAGETLVPLWPLAAVLSVVVIVSVIMLIRQRRLATALDQNQTTQ